MNIFKPFPFPSNQARWWPWCPLTRTASTTPATSSPTSSSPHSSSASSPSPWGPSWGRRRRRGPRSWSHSSGCWWKKDSTRCQFVKKIFRKKDSYVHFYKTKSRSQLLPIMFPSLILQSFNAQKLWLYCHTKMVAFCFKFFLKFFFDKKNLGFFPGQPWPRHLSPPLFDGLTLLSQVS